MIVTVKESPQVSFEAIPNHSAPRGSSVPKTVSVSVCVCTRNRADLLGGTIESILACTVPQGKSVELIVVDNGSTDQTQEVLSRFADPRFPFRTFVETEPGLSRARNRGLQESTADIVIFTDDDVLVPVDWIEGMSSMFDDPSVNAVQGRIRLHEDHVRQWMEPLHRIFLSEFDMPEAVSLTGANMAMRRSCIVACGGFDVDFGAGTALAFGEDTIAGFRMVVRYGKIVVYPGQPVIHRPRLDRSRKSLFKRMEQQVAMEIRMAQVHGATLSSQAQRPVWINLGLLAAKIVRDRIRHPRSPVTQDELGAVRSLLLSRARVASQIPVSATEPVPKPVNLPR